MSIVSETDEPAVNRHDAVMHLRSSMIAVKVVFTWMGVSRTLSKEQKNAAATVFDAAGESISASKKLLDNKHPSWATITKVKGGGDQVLEGQQLAIPGTGPPVNGSRSSGCLQ